MPGLVQLERAYHDRGVQFLGLTGAPADRAQAFIAELGVSYPVLVGAWPTFDAFGVRSVPATYLVDPSGEVVATGLGDIEDELAGRLGG